MIVCFEISILDTDTDFSESEALSSLAISAPAHKVCQSEPEDASGKLKYNGAVLPGLRCLF